MPDESTKITDPFASRGVGAEDVALELDAFKLVLEDLGLKSRVSEEDLRRLTISAEKFNDRMRDLGVNVEKTGNQLSDALRIVNQLATGFLSMTDASRTATNAISSMEGLFRIMGGKGAVVAVFVGLFGKLVNAFDGAIQKQHALIDSHLQLGISYADQTAQVEATSFAVRSAAEDWGYLREEAAKFTSQMTAEGLGASLGDTGAARAARMMRDLPNATQAAMQAHRAYGISIQNTTKLVTQLGTVFGVQAEGFQKNMGLLTEVGSKTALGLNRYLDTIMQLTEMTKVYGRNLAGITLFTGQFSEQLKAGTITMGNLVSIIAPAAMKEGHQAALAAIIQQKDPRLARDLGIQGMDPILAIQQIQDRMKEISDKQAAGGAITSSDDRALSYQRTGIRLFLDAGSKHADFIAKKLMETFGNLIPNITEAANFLRDAGEYSNKQFIKTVNAQDEAAQKLKDTATLVYKTYQTVNQQFIKAGQRFQDWVIQAGKEFRSLVTFGMSRIPEAAKEIGAEPGTAKTVVGGLVRRAIGFAVDPQSFYRGEVPSFSEEAERVAAGQGGGRRQREMSAEAARAPGPSWSAGSPQYSGYMPDLGPFSDMFEPVNRTRQYTPNDRGLPRPAGQGGRPAGGMSVEVNVPISISVTTDEKKVRKLVHEGVDKGLDEYDRRREREKFSN